MYIFLQSCLGIMFTVKNAAEVQCNDLVLGIHIFACRRPGTFLDRLYDFRVALGLDASLCTAPSVCPVLSVLPLAVYRKLIFFPALGEPSVLTYTFWRWPCVAVCCRLRLYFEKASTSVRGSEERVRDLFEKRNLFSFFSRIFFPTLASHSCSSPPHLLSFWLSLSF